MNFDFPEFNISYSLIPFTRNQDLIKVQEFNKKIKFAVSVVDGWNNPDKIKGNESGRKIASFVADNFPNQFLKTDISNLQERSEKAAKFIDKKVLKLYPAHVSCVGAFLFNFDNKNIIVTVGSIFVYVWNGAVWEKPKEIGDYLLDLKNYPSNVSRFFGRGDLKKQNPNLYMAKPDTVVLSPKCSIFIATDGIEELISKEELNNYTNKIGLNTSEKLIKFLTGLIQSRKNLQNDDVSIFLKT